MTAVPGMTRTEGNHGPPLYMWQRPQGSHPGSGVPEQEPGQRQAVAAFTTRRGGVSSGAYATLNLGFASGDRRGAVEENRRLLAGALGTDAGRLLRVQQSHSDHVQVVDRERARRLARQTEPGRAVELGRGDAIVCGVPRWFATVLVADCVPVLIVDSDNQVAAAVHAGWRGSSLGITAAALEAMVQRFGTRPGKCQAFVGPSIGPCCYEVDDPVRSAFGSRLGERAADWFLPGRDREHWQLDLWRANRDLLTAAGVDRTRVAVLGRCTCCHADEFYSYRRDGGATGHLAGVVGFHADGS